MWKAISSHIRALCSLSHQLPWPDTNIVSTCLVTVGSGCSSLAEEGRSRGADWDGVKPGPAGLRCHVQDANDIHITEDFGSTCILYVWSADGGVLECGKSVAGNIDLEITYRIWALELAALACCWWVWLRLTSKYVEVDAVTDHQNPVAADLVIRWDVQERCNELWTHQETQPDSHELMRNGDIQRRF